MLYQKHIKNKEYHNSMDERLEKWKIKWKAKNALESLKEKYYIWKKGDPSCRYF